MRQLRHILKVHAIPAGNQSQREENRGDHGQEFHIGILVFGHFSLIRIADLTNVVQQIHGAAHEPIRTVGDGTEIGQIFAGEKVIFILLQLLAKVVQFIVILDSQS